MNCPYCGQKCSRFLMRCVTEGMTGGFVMITSWTVETDRPTCPQCGAAPMGPEAELNPDLTSEELTTGWYRGSYTLEETFR